MDPRGNKRTGLACPKCKQSAGVIEHQSPEVLVFKCQACGNRRWTYDPGMPKH